MFRPPPAHFKHCPSCGSDQLDLDPKRLHCRACDFTYYFNPTIGVAGFIENTRGQVLLIERAKNPAIGKLAPPGGFADAGESAERALTREVREETGLEIIDWHYLCNGVNHYSYKNVTYPVLDFFFRTELSQNLDTLDLCPHETTGARWIPKQQIHPDSLAFPSMQAAFRIFLKARPD